MLQIVRSTDDLPDLLHGKDGGKFSRFLSDSVVKDELLSHHLVEEKSQSGQCNDAAVGGITLAVFKKQQIIINHLLADLVRGLSIVPGKSGDGGKVGALGVFGKILEFHCPDHLLTKLCHVSAPI